MTNFSWWAVLDLSHTNGIPTHWDVLAFTTHSWWNAVLRVRTIIMESKELVYIPEMRIKSFAV
ncbi:MAG: hypothetical protein WCG99_01260 [Candidatus Berkelbacteria bacterium]